MVLLAPLVQAVLVVVLSRPPGLRDVTHIGGAATVAFAALQLVLLQAEGGAAARIVLARPLPNVDLAFTVEPLGVLVAAALAVLGVFHAAHTAGFVRTVQEPRPARMMGFLAVAHGGAIAVALSANLFSLFVAYQTLILAVFPLIAHGVEDEDQRRAARIFLATLLTASVAMFLPAMVWTYAIAGALDFRTGGALAGAVDGPTANVLLALFALGLAATALPPIYRWLTTSYNSPFPVLVSVQALAVVPAGGVGLLKVVAYVFGPAMAEAAFAGRALLVLAGVGMCLAALIALGRRDVRERLAYSAMAQGLAVVMGAMLAIPAGLFAAALQIVAQAAAAAALLMAAGTIAAVTRRVDVADYAGLGRVMPWTLAGFALGAASMIGLPPFSGAWAKLWLIAAAASTGQIWAAVIAGLAAVLTFAHLAPLAAHALAQRAPADAFKRPDGASFLLVAPVVLCAAATLGLLLLADPLARFLSPVWTPS